MHTIGTPVFPPFDLRHPRDIKATHPEGEPCRTYVKSYFTFVVVLVLALVCC